MISVGQIFPPFKLRATVSLEIDKAFVEISWDTYKDKWLVVFSWPKDFTFVCPTEIAEFGKQNGEFQKRSAQVLGFSVDSEFVHLAWREQNKFLKNLPFPMMSDIKRELSQALGIVDPAEGVAQRATFIVDPAGVVRFVMVTDMQVGRNVKEVLRVLDALQTDELTPCEWESGEETIDIHKAAGKD
jgi:lipoyl-dependent peroxiredoxin subunit C